MGNKSGCAHRASRASAPRWLRMAAKTVCASRKARGLSSIPTRAAKVRSAGPPAARRRRIASVSAALAGSLSPLACDTTSSTHPSMHANKVSSRATAAFCSGVSSGASKPPASTSCSASGLEMSTPPIASDKRSESTRRYCAYCSTAPSTRAASHGTCTNSR